VEIEKAAICKGNKENSKLATIGKQFKVESLSHENNLVVKKTTKIHNNKCTSSKRDCNKNRVQKIGC